MDWAIRGETLMLTMNLSTAKLKKSVIYHHYYNKIINHDLN